MLESALSLAMPYTLERDDLLRGFLCGDEALVKLDVAQRLLTEEMETIHARQLNSRERGR